MVIGVDFLKGCAYNCTCIGANIKIEEIGGC